MKQPSESDRVTILTCEDEAPFDHVRYGFFTRQGGVSEGAYDSLNVGPGSDDHPENVRENRRRAMEAFVGEGEHVLCTLYQVHGSDVVTVTSPFSQDARPQGDAMVTNSDEVVLGILTADCGPVLFADDTAKVIGGAHAGWKGAIGGVLENTVVAMETLGAQKKNITAIIGPCIHQESYEVDAGFYKQFIEKEKHYDAFFTASPTKADHYQFDLPAFIRHRLEVAGVGKIKQVNKDTYANKEQFFSYRRNTHESIAAYGRGLSAITLKSHR